MHPDASVIPKAVVAADVVAALDLLPVAAAQIVRGDGALEYDAVNRAFRQANIGDALFAVQGERIESFLSSPETRVDFAWELDDPVDGRHFRVTLARGRQGARRCVATLVDMTGQHRTERNLRREMTTDSLTGLPNREGFRDLIEQASAKDAQLAVMVLDIARFGRFNACLGSMCGDELLITVARRLRGALRARDTLARIGGDEFGILLLIDDGPDDAHQVARRIQRALSAPFRLTDYEIGVECSIGIAFGRDTDGDVEELIRHAQFAVKRAKTTRATEAYQSQAFAVARAQFGLETALRRAIEERRLRLIYQPIHDLMTGELVAFEALARWTGDDGECIEPSRFIPVAEESGLIVPLGRWALDEAAGTLAGWDRTMGGDAGIRLAVNLSAIQLQRDDVPRAVERALGSAGLPANRITLELTESAFIADPDRIAATLRALRDVGCTLAMDDFGTGYSNLGYLQTLPIDMLKMDRSFVTGMLADRDKIAIVRAILSLAQALGKKTTAEGIETPELARTLAAMGCDFGQGYHFARALEATEALALLAARQSPATVRATSSAI